MKAHTTPLVMYVSRFLFTGLFATAFVMLMWSPIPQSTLSWPWVTYLIIIYGVIEYIYRIFRDKGIDLSYAFPLVFAVFVLNLVSVLLGAQEEVPDLNRAEHLTSFIFAAYIVWIFFTKYLPQKVWQEHPYYTSILVLAVVSMIGVGNEIIELFIDLTFGTHTVGAGFDTSYDLVMNTLGATLFLCSRLILDTIYSPSK